MCGVAAVAIERMEERRATAAAWRDGGGEEEEEDEDEEQHEQESVEDEELTSSPPPTLTELQGAVSDDSSDDDGDGSSGDEPSLAPQQPPLESPLELSEEAAFALLLDSHGIAAEQVTSTTALTVFQQHRYRRVSGLRPFVALRQLELLHQSQTAHRQHRSAAAREDKTETTMRRRATLALQCEWELTPSPRCCALCCAAMRVRLTDLSELEGVHELSSLQTSERVQ